MVYEFNRAGKGKGLPADALWRFYPSMCCGGLVRLSRLAD